MVSQGGRMAFGESVEGELALLLPIDIECHGLGHSGAAWQYGDA